MFAPFETFKRSLDNTAFPSVERTGVRLIRAEEMTAGSFRGLLLQLQDFHWCTTLVHSSRIQEGRITFPGCIMPALVLDEECNPMHKLKEEMCTCYPRFKRIVETMTEMSVYVAVPQYSGTDPIKVWRLRLAILRYLFPTQDEMIDSMIRASSRAESYQEYLDHTPERA